MKKIASSVILALALLCAAACGAAEREFTAEDVAGKIYLCEEEGCGGDFFICIYPDGTFYYYEGFLSSYLGFGDWTVENGVLTMTDDEYGGVNFVNRFRIGENTLTYLQEGSSGFLYVKLTDGVRFNGADMEPVDMAGHTGELLSLDLVRELVLTDSREEYIAALLSEVTCDELVAEWGEPDGMLFGMYGYIWNLDGTHYIVVYFDGNSMVEDVRINKTETEE